MLNQQIVLASRPHGMPRPENFRLIETPTPELEDGQVLIQHNWLGMAPAARLRMSEVASYREPMAIGEVPYGQAVGVVAESRSQAIRVGETVMYTSGGWQEYSVAAAHELIKVDPDLAPPSAWLGPLGTSGFTAYLGLIEIGQARSGETVVVSA
ncbi:MAG: NADP-dependent oxidoreductase, partial [Burkholderiaceae bacterium]